jgi:hypothetical protein
VRVADFSVDFHVRSEADDARLVRAMDTFAEHAAHSAEDGGGFFMVRSEVRQGRTYKNIVFETKRDVDVFLAVLSGDDVRAA